MYLHSHSAGSSRDYKAKPTTFMERTVGHELLNAALSRTVLKDHTSSKLNVKGPKQAEALHKAEIALLRGELKALPEGLREDARVNYLLDQNIKRKNLQDFQCVMIGKVALLLKKNIAENGEDYRKYKVGGYDKGTYGRTQTSPFLSTPAQSNHDLIFSLHRAIFSRGACAVHEQSPADHRLATFFWRSRH